MVDEREGYCGCLAREWANFCSFGLEVKNLVVVQCLSCVVGDAWDDLSKGIGRRTTKKE